jgi:hypothetical protein
VEDDQGGTRATRCAFSDAAKPDSIRHALGEVLAASWDDDAIERAQEPVLV